jgi:hypothetical protein
MADRKITDLTALAAGSQATGDLLTIVDVSESAAADKNKKITVESLFKGIPSNVGIGTSSPGHALDLIGTTSNALRIRSSTAASRGLEIWNDSGNDIAYISNYYNGSIVFQTGNTERLRIDSSGRLLLGTTTEGYSSGDDLTIATSGHTGITLRSGTTSEGAVYFSDATSGGGEYVGSLVYSHNTNSMNFTANGAERMRIDSSGRLAVGTTAQGESSADNLTLADSGNCGLTIRSGTNNGGSVYFSDATSGAAQYDGYISYNHPNQFFAFGTGSTERVRIDSSGVLSIKDSSGSDNISISHDGTNGNITNTGGEFLLYAAGSQNMIFHTNSTERMRIDHSGNVGIGISNVTHKLHVEGSANNQNSEVRIVATQVASGYLGANANGLNIGADVGGILFKTGVTGGGSVGGSGTERMRITSDGYVNIGNSGTRNLNATHVSLHGGNDVDSYFVVSTAASVLALNRQGSDGDLIRFFQNGSQEGVITVSGSTVSYNGGHLARWSQTLTTAEHAELLKGTVMTNLDEMCEWTQAPIDAVLYTEEDELPEGVSVGDVKVPAVEAGPEENEQLNKMAVSSVEGDPNVAGVIVNVDDEGDLNVAMTGDMVIRIAQGTTVARGDLLMSAGDGTAKPQDDDIVRSKTIAKVTSTTVSTTYADGSYCVPCVLMAC